MLERDQMLKELNIWAEKARQGDFDAVIFWDGVLPEKETVEEMDKFITENAEVYYSLLKAYQKSIVKRGINNEF